MSRGRSVLTPSQGMRRVLPMTTTNLNLTPYRVAIVAAFQTGKTASELAFEEAKSVGSIYALTGDIRFVRAARRMNAGRVTVR